MLFKIYILTNQKWNMKKRKRFLLYCDSTLKPHSPVTYESTAVSHGDIWLIKLVELVSLQFLYLSLGGAIGVEPQCIACSKSAWCFVAVGQ